MLSPLAFTPYDLRDTQKYAWPNGGNTPTKKLKSLQRQLLLQDGASSVGEGEEMAESCAGDCDSAGSAAGTSLDDPELGLLHGLNDVSFQWPVLSVVFSPTSHCR